MFKKLFFTALMASMALFAGELQTVDQTNFDKTISSGLVLVDFYGPWCGPCKRLMPTLEAVSDSMKGQVKIVKVNIDNSHELAENYKVKGVPTLILFKNGKEVDRLVGYRDQNTIENFIKTNR